jgi:hypothetical protein
MEQQGRLMEGLTFPLRGMEGGSALPIDGNGRRASLSHQWEWKEGQHFPVEGNGRGLAFPAPGGHWRMAEA